MEFEAVEPVAIMTKEGFEVVCRRGILERKHFKVKWKLTRFRQSVSKADKKFLGVHNSNSLLTPSSFFHY